MCIPIYILSNYIVCNFIYSNRHKIRRKIKVIWRIVSDRGGTCEYTLKVLQYF